MAMPFHLNHHPKKFDFELTHRDGIFFSGSCFAEHLANKMQALHFTVHRNPGGILFNPESIRLELEAVLAQKTLDEALILERQGIYYSFAAHSSCFAKDQTELKTQVKRRHEQALEALKRCRLLVISFGTALIYRHKGLNTVVGNCHKQAQQNFDKNRLWPEEIVQAYHPLLQSLHHLNPGLQLLFTVSPVKYLREGLEQNALSKASLLLAVHRLVSAYSFCHYFPAYELLTDDLRDYRFYKEDLAHPNAQAITYIWEKFAQTAFSENTLQLIAEIEKLNMALQHRQMAAVMDPKFEDFVASQKRKILAIEPGLGI